MRFAILVTIIIVTALAFIPMTQLSMEDGKSTATVVLGMPVLGLMSERACWLSIGIGTGVLFIGLVGAGVVALAVGAGGGILAGVGQGACGLIAIGQLGFGLVFTLAQLGTGAAGLGQLIFGVLVAGQVPVGRNGADFLRTLNKDLNEILKP